MQPIINPKRLIKAYKLVKILYKKDHKAFPYPKKVSF